MYHALHYRPGANDPNDPVQALFIGVSLNVQHVLDSAVMRRAGSGPRSGGGWRALRFGTEIAAVPFTTAAIGGVSRTAAQPPLEE